MGIRFNSIKDKLSGLSNSMGERIKSTREKLRDSRDPKNAIKSLGRPNRRSRNIVSALLVETERISEGGDIDTSADSEASQEADNPTTSARANTDTSQLAGLQHMKTCIAENLNARALSKSIFILYSLIQMSFKQNESKKLMSYLGFSDDLILTYLQGVLGSLNPDFKKRSLCTSLVQNKDTFSNALFEDVLRLNGKDNETIARRIKQFDEICIDLDLDQLIHRRELANFGSILEYLISNPQASLREIKQELEDHLDIEESTSPENREEQLSNDLAKLRAVIQGNPTSESTNEEAHSQPEPETEPQPEPRETRNPDPEPTVDPDTSTNNANGTEPEPEPEPEGNDEEKRLADEMTISLFRIRQLILRIQSAEENERDDMVSQINRSRVGVGNLLGTAFELADPDDVLSLILNHFDSEIDSDADLVKKAREVISDPDIAQFLI